MSVKCVLITDKSAQNGTLSVNLNEILAESLSSTAFRSAGQNQSQIDRLRSVFHLIQARNGTFFPDSFKLRHILLSNYLVEVATLVSEDAEDDEDDAAEFEASDDAFFFALSRLSFSKSLLSTSGASVS